MSRITKTTPAPELTLEERRERRQLRREKQRQDNVQRAAKMHARRLKMEATSLKATSEPKAGSLLDAPAGVTGIGGIRSMQRCHNQIGSSII